jgi:hypothetical protein
VGLNLLGVKVLGMVFEGDDNENMATDAS